MAHKKIIFITMFIGDKSDVHDFQIKNNSMITNYKNLFDAYLFTNLDACDIVTNFWQVKTIDIKKHFEGLNNVQISRFFKFNIHHTLNILKSNTTNYDYYIYCNSRYIPQDIPNILKLAQSTNTNKFGLLQYKHPSKSINPLGEIELIIKWKKETKKNMDEVKKYLRKLCNNNKEFDNYMNTSTYIENSIIIYDLNNEFLKDYLLEFYINYYLKYPTYRDQPIWNFLLFKNNITPIIKIKDEVTKLFHKINNKTYNINVYTKQIL